MDHTQNFSGLAASYAAGRPAYPDELIDCLYTRYGFDRQSVIADVGAGTGKFARMLLSRGSTVYGVEPNEDMRRTAVAELAAFDRFHPICGTEAHTTLRDHSVDFVTTAQAFHWFHPQLFRRECQRILRHEGLAFLIWNMRDMTDAVNQETHELYAEFCPKFRGFSCGIQPGSPSIREFFGGAYESLAFENSLHYTREKFISRSLSSSYTLQAGDPRYGGYLAGLNALFDRHVQNGVLTVANQTVAYIGKPE